MAALAAALGDVTLRTLWEVQRDVVTWSKAHRAPGAALRVLGATVAWARSAGDPPVLGVDRARGRLLLGHVAGEPALGLGAPAALAALESLGATLRRLRTWPFVDPVPLNEALQTCAAAWAARARGTPAAAAVARRWARLDLPPASRVPCHRDVELRHVGLHGGARLVDFGQARPDHPLLDVVRLLAEPDALRDGAEEALWRGLGSPAEGERPALDALRASHGVATWVWALGHRHAALAARGASIASRWA